MPPFAVSEDSQERSGAESENPAGKLGAKAGEPMAGGNGLTPIMMMMMMMDDDDGDDDDDDG